MKVPALYFAPGSSEGLPVGVRVHNRATEAGALGGASQGWSEAAEISPKLIFDRLEQAPVRGAIVSVEAGEAYAIGVPRPADQDGFITAEVSPLSAAQIAAQWPSGQPLPGA